MHERIVIDPNIQHGKPVIGGTRVPVARVIGSLAGGMTPEAICQDYDIEEADLRAALQYAAELIDAEQVYPLPPRRLKHALFNRCGLAPFCGRCASSGPD
jgi:uncharacterized protein (DUF433 family)